MSELFQSIENAGWDQGRRRRSQDGSFEVPLGVLACLGPDDARALHHRDAAKGM